MYKWLKAEAGVVELISVQLSVYKVFVSWLGNFRIIIMNLFILNHMFASPHRHLMYLLSFSTLSPLTHLPPLTCPLSLTCPISTALSHTPAPSHLSSLTHIPPLTCPNSHTCPISPVPSHSPAPSQLPSLTHQPPLTYPFSRNCSLSHTFSLSLAFSYTSAALSHL